MIDNSLAAEQVSDTAIDALLAFFEKKGLAALKQEDRAEQWYEDWIAYQAKHQIYAKLLSPKQFSTLGGQLDLLRLTRFLEVFAYCSPAHGYSFQVTFLGLFSILMGENVELKQEAVAALERGGLLAFGVSERNHGADLLGNEFAIREISPGRFIAGGSKYYIGNANAAAMMSILARKEDPRANGKVRRAPIVLIALRPGKAKGYGSVRKIHTLGVRAGFVGEFKVVDHEMPASDIIAEGRRAWDAALGTVTLGKFLLGFASIGICRHAMDEAGAHLSARMLFGKPVTEMPHIRATLAQAYVRLAAMKLYAGRALDYVHAATEDERRYLLFNAVQKAKVSSEAVKVVSLLSECMGAKGFEADTYFEMALRDVQLIPGLEGSTHINLGMTAQFIEPYFKKRESEIASPKSLTADELESTENPYLMNARLGAINSIQFAPYGIAYRPLAGSSNIRVFAKQVKSFALLIRTIRAKQPPAADMEMSMAFGQCLAQIAYAQLIAENAVKLNTPPQLVSAIFQLLVGELSLAATALLALPHLPAASRALIPAIVVLPRHARLDWEFIWGTMVPWAPVVSVR